MQLFPNPLNRPSLLRRPTSFSSEPQYVQGRLLDVFDFFSASRVDLQSEQLLTQAPSEYREFIVLGVSQLLGDEASQVTESAEMNWLRTNGFEVAKHRGEWLLITTDGLAAHSREFSELKRIIERERLDSPFVYYVPTKEESNFTLI